MTETSELFENVFVYVLQFVRMAQQQDSGFQPSYEQVREHIRQSLAQAKRVANDKHMQAAEFDEARFAVEAWADECILKHRTWNHYGAWANNTLVYEEYSNRRAGVEFFDRLARLPADQQESCKVYHRCLTLGFCGRYTHDKLKLTQIRLALAQQVCGKQSEVQSVDKLIPQPYTTLSQTTVLAQSLYFERLRTVTRLLLATAPLMLLLVKLMPFSLPSALALQARIEDALAPYKQQPCTKITVGVIESAGQVTLAGRVPNETQRNAISSVVQNISGVRLLNNDTLEVISRPACEVLDLLDPFQARQTSGVSITLKKGLPDGRVIAVDRANPLYYFDDNLLIEVVLPFESYVYIDYYDTKQNPPSFGEVTHLVPSSLEPHRLRQPNGPFMVGPLGIGLPAGRDLVTVIASKTALLAGPDLVTPGRELKVETAETYLTKLRQVLQGVTKSDVIAAFSFLQNTGRNPTR